MEKRTKKKIIWSVVATLVLGTTAAAFGHYFVVCRKKSRKEQITIIINETQIKPKIHEGDIETFRDSIGYSNSTTAIDKFEEKFDVINHVDGAEYYIENFDEITISGPNVLKVKASKAYNESKEPVDNVNFEVPLTLKEVVENPDPEEKMEMFTITKDGILSITEGWIETEEGIEWAKKGELQVPAIFKNVKVTKIADNFIDPLNRKIKTYFFDKECTFTEIGKESFSNYKSGGPAGSTINMNTFYLPSTVEVIGDYAFFKNSYSSQIEFPSNLKTIGNYAFSQITKSLMGIELPRGVEKIGEGAFATSSYRGKLDIPNSVKIIGKKAFYNTNFQTIGSLGSGVEEIGESAFENFEVSINELTLPDSLKIVGEKAFRNATKIRSLKLGTGLKHIGSEAFYFISGANPQFIKLPEGLLSIGDFAFRAMTGGNWGITI
ncbi:MAG: leucine-rich repeat domain-containing protein, partial [Mycoplasma sp.]